MKMKIYNRNLISVSGDQKWKVAVAHEKRSAMIIWVDDLIILQKIIA